LARNAADIAEARCFRPDDKLRRLDRWPPSRWCAAERTGWRVTGGRSDARSFRDRRHRAALPRVLHCLCLDTVKLRYRDWGDLMEYAAISGRRRPPAARFAGENQATWPASDALCSALQCNHCKTGAICVTSSCLCAVRRFGGGRLRCRSTGCTPASPGLPPRFGCALDRPKG